MKIAILGGGITGLTAAYYLQKKGHITTLFEKETNLGGLAAGFKPENSGWDWPLERAYHHIFSSDTDIIDFAKEIGFNDIFFTKPVTASLYQKPDNQSPITNKFSVYPLDTPLDLLRFPLLPLIQKIRAGIVLAFLKFSPFLKIYENQSAKEFLQKSMGSRVWEVLWQELFRKKFGKYAGNIVASFIWARVNKRTKKLGYMTRGFQSFVDFIEETDIKIGVTIKKGTAVELIERVGEKFVVNGEPYDAVISTLPTTLMTKVAKNIFPEDYLNKFEKLHYLHAVNLIIESKMPLFDKEYWVSICTSEMPFMVAVQHTNMIDKKKYGNNHILYVGNYIDGDSKLLKMENKEILDYFLPHLKKINPQFEPLESKVYTFKAPWAQPIFDTDFIKNKPDFITPIKNFFIANLDMTYPYDRGTNYAVKLGKEVASLI